MTKQPPMTRAEIAAARERLDEEMSFGKMLHAVGSLPRALDTLEQALELLTEWNDKEWRRDSLAITRVREEAREFLRQVEGAPG